MFERFDADARQAVVTAQDEARRNHDPSIGTEHLLLALAGQDSSPAGKALHSRDLDDVKVRALVLRWVGDPLDGQALAALGIDLDQVRRAVETRFGVGALNPRPARRTARGHIPFSRRAKKVLELSVRAAGGMRAPSITTAHLLIGIIDEAEGVGARVLRESGLDVTELRSAMVTASGDEAA